MKSRLRPASAALLLALLAPLAHATKDVPFVPTSDEVTVAMLKLAGVGPGDHVIDLGSGDGRIVIAAASQFGASGLGVEIVPDLVAKSIENAKRAGVEGKVKFVEQDLFKANLAAATVVTLYLMPDVNLKLRPSLLELKAGTRIVSHDWNIRDSEARPHGRRRGLERKAQRTQDEQPAPLGRARRLRRPVVRGGQRHRHAHRPEPGIPARDGHRLQRAGRSLHRGEDRRGTLVLDGRRRAAHRRGKGRPDARAHRRRAAGAPGRHRVHRAAAAAAPTRPRMAAKEPHRSVSEGTLGHYESRAGVPRRHARPRRLAEHRGAAAAHRRHAALHDSFDLGCGPGAT